MKKVRSIFLCIGLTIFAVSFVVFAVDTVISAINSYQATLKDDIYGARGHWFWILMNVVLIPAPFLVSELLLIRNGYLLLSKEQPTARKVLCVFSSVLAIFVIIMLVLWEKGFFDYRIMYHIQMNILFSLQPCVLVAFILGAKRKRAIKDQLGNGSAIDENSQP